MTITTILRPLAVAPLLASLAAPSFGQQTEEEPLGSRWAVSLDMLIWPALTDLEPVSGGSFDSVGFGLGVSWHAPVAQFASSELLFGIDGWIGGTDSGVNATYGQLIARQFYLGGSVKWAFGEARNVQLDAGIGYHQVDMADISYSWWTSIENEHWGGEAASGFVGATWDIGAGKPGKSSGFSLGFRVQFSDFGQVSDTDRLGIRPALGPDAGDLNGPLYVLKVGYSGR
jgi:hypothetical protein